MSLLGVLLDEQARRRRIRRRLEELEQRSAQRDAWAAHWGEEHDARSCEYCLPVPRQAHKAY